MPTEQTQTHRAGFKDSRTGNQLEHLGELVYQDLTHLLQILNTQSAHHAKEIAAQFVVDLKAGEIQRSQMCNHLKAALLCLYLRQPNEAPKTQVARDQKIEAFLTEQASLVERVLLRALFVRLLQTEQDLKEILDFETFLNSRKSKEKSS